MRHALTPLESARMKMIAGLAVLFASAAAIGVADASPIYEVTALQNLSGLSIGTGMNDSGQVTGVATGADRAFITDANGTNLRTLGNLGTGSSVGFAINNSGQVAGQSQTTTSPFAHAFITDAGGGNLRDLGHLGGN